MAAAQISEFELQGLTATLAIMYKKTLEYLKLQLSIDCDRLHVINPQNLKVMTKQAVAYKVALNSFTI